MEFQIVIDDGVLQRCWLASLAYACGWKRAYRHYLLDAQILMTSVVGEGEQAETETVVSISESGQ